MTLIPTQISFRIARLAEQGTRPAKPTQVAVDKLAPESNPNHSLLKGKNRLKMHTLNVQTLYKLRKIPELLLSPMDTKQDVVSIREHRIGSHNVGEFKLIACSDWKNSIHATIGVIGILLNKNSSYAFNSIDQITNRIMVAHFNRNPKTNITVCYSVTNVS